MDIMEREITSSIVEAGPGMVRVHPDDEGRVLGVLRAESTGSGGWIGNVRRAIESRLPRQLHESELAERDTAREYARQRWDYIERKHKLEQLEWELATDEAYEIAHLFSERLSQLAFDYQRMLYMGQGHRKLKRTLVKFDHVEVDSDQYRFHVNSRQLPRGRGINEKAMSSDDVVLSLGLTIQKPVSYHLEPGIGLWYLVDREHGLGNIPMSISFAELSEAMANKRKGGLKIPIGLGAGREEIVIDMGRETTAHFAVGGTTGGGKSSLLHVIICTLISQNTPDELQLVLFDFKRAEFIPFYTDVPHLMGGNIIYEPHDFAARIRELSAEVDERYNLMMNKKVTNIKQYNRDVPKSQRLPYIVIFIDETSRVLLDKTIPKADKDNSTSAMANIASLGRACGVHLIIATQRPDAQTLPGLVRACMPGKIAYACASDVESKVILNNTNACFRDRTPPGRAILAYSRYNLPFQTAWLSEAERREIVADVIAGRIAERRMSHDVTMEELAAHAMINWNGAFKQAALYDEFKARGITKREIRRLAKIYLEEPFVLNGEQFILINPGKRLSYKITLYDDNKEK